MFASDKRMTDNLNIIGLSSVFKMELNHLNVVDERINWQFNTFGDRNESVVDASPS